jgi:preprotein translocase subunit SecE
LNRNKETKKITKKGIIITTLIVIGIVASSFIVYLVP